MIRPEKTRVQRRQTKQLLEEMLGVDYARYLEYFSHLS
jgi:hypothetical protein